MGNGKTLLGHRKRWPLVFLGSCEIKKWWTEDRFRLETFDLVKRCSCMNTMSWTNNSLINKSLSFVPLILREAKLKIVAWFILEQSSEHVSSL